MRPRSLTLQAFGPFAGREVVAFTKLPPDALFLIHGPTGAGKSTLLDGICYALYGTTSGGERQPKEMRSHHAADNMQTEVELEFDLGAKRYRVKRIPEQERAASTGAPRPVKVLGKAEFHEWNGTEWNLLATKATEVSSRIATLLGFEADQFRQVIMLPQGQFRRLLSADSKDREKILEALFATEIYKRLQEHLQSSARKLEDSATDAKNKRAVFLQQAEVDSDEALAQLIAESKQVLDTLVTNSTQLRKEAETAQQALSLGEALAAKFTEHSAAKSALDQLLVTEATVAAERIRHERALRAQAVTPTWTNLGQARGQHSNNLSKVAQATENATNAAAAMLKASASLEVEEQKAPERETASREISRLEESRAAVVRLSEADVARKAAAQHHKATKVEADKLEQQLKTQAEQRTVLIQQVETLTPLAVRAEALKLEVAHHELQLKVLQQIATSNVTVTKLKGESTQHQTALATAQRKLETARQSLADCDTQWRAGQAAVLATHLANGAACPVCGSHDHPHPADSTSDIPSEMQLKAAADQVAKDEV